MKDFANSTAGVDILGASAPYLRRGPLQMPGAVSGRTLFAQDGQFFVAVQNGGSEASFDEKIYSSEDEARAAVKRFADVGDSGSGESSLEEQAVAAENQAKVAAAMFTANPLNATAAKNAAQAQQDAAKARAAADAVPFIMRVYGPLPLYGYAAIGVGGLAALGVALKLIFRKRA
jgi:hypothetical protein